MSENLDKRKYLKPEIVTSLSSLALRARLIVEGYIIGKHRSPYHGFSVEFAEHKSYDIGDDVRNIDWKLFGKTDRLYIKRYEEETNLKTHIIIDNSKSMSYSSGSVSKINYANSLLASIAYLMINQQDAVGLIQFSDKINSFIPPKSRRSHLNTIINQLSETVEGKDTFIEPVLHEMAERINKRGLVILVSDLLDDPKTIMNGLKHFRHRKQEVIVFHILDKKEIDFDFNKRTKFIDVETGEELSTEPWHIRENYKRLMKERQKLFKKECNNQLIDYVPVLTNESLEKCIAEYLNKRKKLF
ncbi:DUF58 domain-containing protein [Candidatus Marinimicrobia bacterium]|jgi:uncharacterized protein (DUF58 family)|nr:DUF58 domain-containing protein [Candidatus Neomarinimicrobiota bacterium]MDC0383207.1 DUF58 domain-containing protein [Candidatus Neomarinimicrobiota bacterium]